MIAGLVRAELAARLGSRSTLIVALLTVVGSAALAPLNAAAYRLPLDDPRLFSAEPVALADRGFEMAAGGIVVIVALGALVGGADFGRGRAVRSTVLAVPRRRSFLLVRMLILAGVTAVLAAGTLLGALLGTHASLGDGLSPAELPSVVGERVLLLSLSWVCVAILACALAVLSRGMIVPLLVLIPLLIGLGEFLVTVVPALAVLPGFAGVSMATGAAAGSWSLLAVQGLGTLLVALAAVETFARRDI